MAQVIPKPFCKNSIAEKPTIAISYKVGLAHIYSTKSCAGDAGTSQLIPNPKKLDNMNRKTMPFVEAQLLELGVTDENNCITVFNPEAEHPEPKRCEIRCFEADRKGNLRINFWTIDRQLIPYYRKGSGKMSVYNATRDFFHQIRLQEPKGDMKYIIPKGTGAYPYFPPKLCDYYEQQREIKTLFLTEGAKKAWRIMAVSDEVYCVGLTSITHYKDPETGKLHQDILRLIDVCKVQNIVVLWDGDCLDISEKDLSVCGDLSKRPATFYNSIKQIRSLVLQHDRDLVVTFYHVNSDSLPGKPKGLDDLVLAAEKAGEVEDVIKEMPSPTSRKNKYFVKKVITSSIAPLLEYFCLKNANDFWDRHREIIGDDTQFNFRGDVYKWDTETDELVLVRPAWAERVFRIGDEYFELIDKPTINEESNNEECQFRRELVKRSAATLRLNYGKKFHQYVRYFEGFCCIPDHFDFKLEHHGFFNRYHPLKHTPQKGDISYTLRLIKHIFGEEEREYKGKRYPMYELGLDYVQLLLTCPTQQLPVLILYSPENQTGKSTFGNLLLALFSDNAISINNSDLKSDFNEPFAGRLLAICEETLLDRRSDVERIKALSTAKQVTINAKNQRQYSIDFFCKFQFYSNRKRMIHVTEHDDRFWILKVKTIQDKDPMFQQKVIQEIPAFMHFLQHRELCASHEGRMYFHPDLYLTETFRDTVSINEPSEARHLRERLEDLFAVLEEDGVEQIEMPLKHVNKEFFNGNQREGWLKEILTDYLKADRYTDDQGRSKTKRGKYPKITEAYNAGKISDEDEDYSPKIEWVGFNGRPYIFKRADFISD